MTATDPATTPTGVGLVSDHYEIRMADLAFRSGFAHDRVLMEVRARDLHRPARSALAFGMRAAVRRQQSWPAFEATTLQWLVDHDDLHPDTIEFLERYRFSGHIGGLPEGEVVFADTPILVVEGSFAEVIVLGCSLMSSINVASALGTAAFNYVDAAAGRHLSETTLRHLGAGVGDLAVEACHAAGFSDTAGLAGSRFGVPTIGNCSHAVVLLFEDESHAFHALHDTYGDKVTVLVDTYEIEAGIDRAVSSFSGRLGAIRIDSGCLADEARRARSQLDRLGSTRTRIVVSGDLTPEDLRSLRGSPIDGYVIGSRLAGALGFPTIGVSYKLAAVDRGSGASLTPVGKRSPLRSDPVGAARVARQLDRSCRIVDEQRIQIDTALQVPDDDRRTPWMQYVRNGSSAGLEDLGSVRARVRSNHAALALDVIGET